MSLNLKLPHWAMVAIGIAGAVIAYLLSQQANGSLVLPAAVVGVLSLVNTLLGLFSSSALAPAAKPMAEAPAPGVESAVASATAAGAAALQASEPKS